MLVKFAIDPAVIAEGDYPRLVHERLQRLWVKDRLGVLVDTLWKGKFNTLEAFRSLKDKYIAEKWILMYKQAVQLGLLDAVPATRRISGQYDDDEVRSLAKQIDVLVTKSDLESMSIGQVSLEDDGRKVLRVSGEGNRQIEVVDLDYFDFCEKTERVKEIRNRGIVPEGSLVTEIWNERFKDEYQSKGSVNIHVVDRYCLEDRKDGLGRFISLAKSTFPPSKKGKILHVYATVPEGVSTDPAYYRVQNWLREHNASPDPFMHAIVHIINGRKFGKITADRYIRFGQLIVLGGGHATEIFEAVSGRTHRANQAVFHTDIEGCTELERKLSDAHMDCRKVDHVMFEAV